MAKDKVAVNGSKGLYYVEVGRTSAGKQPRVYLGRVDEVTEDEARVRRARVRDFWNRLQAGGMVHVPGVTHVPGEWSEVTLEWAKAIAKGVHTLVLPVDVGAGLIGHPFAAIKIKAMNAKFAGLVTWTVPEEIAEAHSGTMASLTGTPRTTPGEGGAGLHHYLHAYADHMAKTMTEAGDDGAREATEWSVVYSKAVRSITRAVADMPLSSFDYDAIEAVVLHYANRPASLKSGKPISVKYAKHVIKAFKRFLKWLPKHSAWRKPNEWDEAFEAKPKTTTQEKRERPIGVVKAYRVDDLPIIYRYATPYERCLFLLALNCGFGAAEISQLKVAECYIDPEDNSYIKRVRTKSTEGVYGEHLLWPETVQALQWSMGRVRQIVGDVPASANAVIRDSGKSIVTKTKGGRSNKAASAWEKLNDRIRKDYPEFPVLSFGKLRKTSGNLIKMFSDGETVAVFHQRSSAVKTDDEAELYSDRLFERVWHCQREVHRLLAPMWAVVPEPFPASVERTALGIRTIDMIRAMWRQGAHWTEIVKESKASRATVWRLRPEAVVRPTSTGTEA